MNWLDLSLKLPITDPTWIFLLVLLIILFAPILLTKLRIPHIIGMILAGLAIGEHGFNILVRDSSFELFGKVGVYYIMFLAGLEMNMADFKKNRGKAVALGLLAFIIPISIGMVTNVLLLKYSLITSILLASMYASHTLVAYPIVIRYGISRQRSVSIAVGGTAVTDTLTLLVLAVISGVFKVIRLVSRVVMEISLGRTSDLAGISSTSSKVRPSPTKRSENSKAKKAKAGSAGWIYPFIREKLWRT